MTTQKEIASNLDVAAGRACHIDRDPATRKQCWFLAKLLADHNADATAVGCGCLNTQAVLTKKSASKYISEILDGVGLGAVLVSA